MLFAPLLAIISLVVAPPAALASSPDDAINSRVTIPDIYEIKIAHLDPEDAVFDKERKLLYQSNLYRAKVAVSNTKSGHLFDAHIPGISSDEATTRYELAGLSLDKADKPSRLYGVAKDHSAFTFGPKQSVRGPNAFVAFDLPLSSSSKPVYNLDLHAVQGQIEKEQGTWPFAPVDSAQDEAGNSYIVFALGAPAIAKVGPDGTKAEPFSFEPPTSIIPNRTGYTGVAYIPTSYQLVAYGGPRLLTRFDLNSFTPSKANAVQIKGPPIKWSHAEKINLIASLDGTGDRLVVTNAPDVISFRSTDGWKTATYKKFTRPELKNNSLTTVTELEFEGGMRGIYGAGAYFGKGKFCDRMSWPLYRLGDELLEA